MKHEEFVYLKTCRQIFSQPLTEQSRKDFTKLSKLLEVLLTERQVLHTGVVKAHRRLHASNHLNRDTLLARVHVAQKELQDTLEEIARRDDG